MHHVMVAVCPQGWQARLVDQFPGDRQIRPNASKFGPESVDRNSSVFGHKRVFALVLALRVPEGVMRGDSWLVGISANRDFDSATSSRSLRSSGADLGRNGGRFPRSRTNPPDPLGTSVASIRAAGAQVHDLPDFGPATCTPLDEHRAYTERLFTLGSIAKQGGAGRQACTGGPTNRWALRVAIGGDCPCEAGSTDARKRGRCTWRRRGKVQAYWDVYPGAPIESNAAHVIASSAHVPKIPESEKLGGSGSWKDRFGLARGPRGALRLPHHRHGDVPCAYWPTGPHRHSRRAPRRSARYVTRRMLGV